MRTDMRRTMLVQADLEQGTTIGPVLERLAINDLAQPVFRRHPELAGIRDALADRGADIALLCGSGSCVAGLFSDESVLDGVADSFSRVEGLSTIRTRTLR